MGSRDLASIFDHQQIITEFEKKSVELMRFGISSSGFHLRFVWMNKYNKVSNNRVAIQWNTNSTLHNFTRLFDE